MFYVAYLLLFEVSIREPISSTGQLCLRERVFHFLPTAPECLAKQRSQSSDITGGGFCSMGLRRSSLRVDGGGRYVVV